MMGWMIEPRARLWRSTPGRRREGPRSARAVVLVLGVDAQEAHLPAMQGVGALQRGHLLLAGHAP